MKGHEQYLKTMVETAPPLDNLIALYEKCLLHLAATREGLAAGELPVWSAALHRAMDILCYLEASLDAGHPDQAEPLRHSYRMILGQLGQVSASQDRAALERAERWLEEMLAAWRAGGHPLHGDAATPAGREGGE